MTDAAGGRSAARPLAFPALRGVVQPPVALPPRLPRNARIRMDGLDLLAALPEAAFPAASSTTSPTATRTARARSGAPPCRR